MDLRILSPPMGRKKKPEVRGSVSIRMLPDIERRLIELVEKQQAKSKSNLAETLLAVAIEMATFDQSFTEFVDLWKTLGERDRLVLLRMAESLNSSSRQLELDPPTEINSAADDNPRAFVMKRGGKRPSKDLEPSENQQKDIDAALAIAEPEKPKKKQK